MSDDLDNPLASLGVETELSNALGTETRTIAKSAMQISLRVPSDNQTNGSHEEMTQQQWDMLPAKIINPNDDWFLQFKPIDVPIRRFEESEKWGYDYSFGSNDKPTSPIEEEFVIEAKNCDVEEIGVQPKPNEPATTSTDQPRGFRLETTLEYNQQGLPTSTSVPTVVCTTTYHLGEITPAVRAVHMLHEQQPAPVEKPFPVGSPSQCQRLKTYKKKLVVFPRRVNKFKAGDSTAEELANATQVQGSFILSTVRNLLSSLRRSLKK
ncbi:hypothetical protein GIB67_001919 [Kingdonia uniflora]|uniref:Uncharacterized protein n=1 Tax=Kingdonia uniflora TaxID=39325 RepID=A0A7J7NW72_9MAGN|nr:hypothetical protein GIB67_001919 [Kingdonia uniflora]